MGNKGIKGSPTAALAAYMLVEERLQLVEREIERACHSEIALVRRNAQYLHRSGGKRLRPAIVLLCAPACGYEGERDVQLGAVLNVTANRRRCRRIGQCSNVGDHVIDDRIVEQGCGHRCHLLSIDIIFVDTAPPGLVIL